MTEEISVAAGRRRQAAANAAGHLSGWLSAGGRELFAAIGDKQVDAYLGGLVSALAVVISGGDRWAERQSSDVAEREAAELGQVFGVIQSSTGGV